MYFRTLQRLIDLSSEFSVQNRVFWVKDSKKEKKTARFLMQKTCFLLEI